MLKELEKYIDKDLKTNNIYGFKNHYGVKIPVLRKIAKQIAIEKNYEYFNQPHESFEEIIIHAFAIGYLKEDIDKCLNLFEKFIPQIDNWAVNDGLCQNFKIAKKNQAKTYQFLLKYTNSTNEWEIRVVAVMLLSHFINDNYVDKAIKILDNLKQVSYMAKMGIAWAVCEVMCRYPNKCFEYLKVSKLDKWTYNKAISKMIESFRVSKENKEKLRQMKRK